MSDDPMHLDPETLQSYLDRELDAPRRGKVEAHLAACSDCAGELEAWQAIFGGLEDLPVLTPSPGFRRSVTARLHPELASHPTPDVLQDRVEGTLPRAARSRIDAHVAQCPPCGSELRRWQDLHGTLDSLPRLAPSPGFAARIMEQLVPSAAPAPVVPLWDRIRAVARGWIPKTPVGRGVAATAVLAPAMAFLVLLAVLALNPLFEPADLAAFAALQLTDLWQLASSQALQLAVDTALLVWGSGALATVRTFPALAFGGLIAVWAAVVTSGWVLYRNVVVPTGRSRHHVHASS